MPHSVAQLPEPQSAGPPSAGERKSRDLSMRAESSNTSICQRHLTQAERHRMCLPRKLIELCQPNQPHRRWHKVRRKRSGSRRPNGVPLAGLPHCQHAGVDCAWVLHCSNRARETEVPGQPHSQQHPITCSCTMPRCMAA